MKETGRPKGGKNKTWSEEEKLRMVKRYQTEGIGGNKIALEEGVSKGLFWSWIKAYQEKGESGLKKQKKPGNPYAALHTSKRLTETERLELTIAKQRVEIERLKKGYTVKGDGAAKVFVTIKDKNIL